MVKVKIRLSSENLILSKRLGDKIHYWPQVSQYIFAEYAILQASPSSDPEPSSGS